MISTRGPRCVATGISQCLRQQWSHVNPVHSSSVPPSGQPFRYTPSWRTGYFSLLGAHPFLRHQNQDSMTPQLLTTSQLHTNVATAATHTSHRTFPSYPSVHPFLLLPVAASRIACNPRHHYHSMAAITCTRRYTSDSKLPPQQPHRSGYYSHWRPANRSTLTYMVAIAVAVVGLAYAAVPLYRLFCQASGYGGTVIRTDPGEKVEKMQPIRERELTIRFNADTSAGMRWQFKPDQKEIKLVPGETALAFYTARNPTDEAVTGIAMYNVIPFEAGQYFNKIQCFCFEEQRLNPREKVDMPVFFYIDPEFNEDPAMARVDSITLSYTFFQAKEGETLNLPLPGQTL